MQVLMRRDGTDADAESRNLSRERWWISVLRL